MLRPIVLKVQLFRSDDDAERLRSEACLRYFLEALTRTNETIFRAEGRRIPNLYDSGIRYLREQGTEEWQDVYENLALMTGDCEDLACHRVAELRQRFAMPGAQPDLTWHKLPGGMLEYHVRARHANGTIEDPSKLLGMNAADGLPVPQLARARAIASGRVGRLLPFRDRYAGFGPSVNRMVRRFA